MTAPATTGAGYDLRTFFRAVGNPLFGPGLTSDPVDRVDCAQEVEMLEETAQVRITAPPLDVQAFIDGVQSCLVVTHREHRPVFLTYQAAGAVGAGAVLLDLRERLTLVHSVADSEWVAEVNQAVGIPTSELPDLSPPDVERSAYAQLGDWRERLERSLVEDLVDDGVGPLVVDGSLLARPFNTQLGGVVKNVVATRYLPDEAILYGLPEGWRSPIFRLPQGTNGSPYDRYSCYVRLHDARYHSWSHGLIRLEAFDPDVLGPLAARAMVERQFARSGDGRWDRHLVSVATAEKVLRARRPKVFDFS
jgi:hypothetical protein